MIACLLSLPLWALALVLNIWLAGFALASLWAPAMGPASAAAGN